MEEFCREHGIVLEAYAPFASGAFGMLKDPVITRIAEETGTSAGQARRSRRAVRCCFFCVHNTRLGRTRARTHGAHARSLATTTCSRTLAHNEPSPKHTPRPRAARATHPTRTRTRSLARSYFGGTCSSAT